MKFHLHHHLHHHTGSMELRKMISSSSSSLLAESSKINLQWLISIGLFICLMLVAQQQGMFLIRHPLALNMLPATIANASQVLHAVRLEEKAAGIYKASRRMYGIGRAEYTFVLAGAYRTGPSSFGIVGLASRALHTFGDPTFECSWHSDNQSKPLVGSTMKLLTDWKLGRIYSAYVVHCNFPGEKATQSGGKLHFAAGTSRSDGDAAEVIALEEKPGDFNESSFPGGQGFQHKYDYLYCGSSLFGDIDPNQLSQWMAYHAMLLGPRSHFVLHDGGGLKSEANQKVLEPWVKAGLVTVHDFSEQEKFDGYYHNQFLLVNDCFFRYKHAANWTFFFDVDEYIYVPPPRTLGSVLETLGKDYSQIMFQQNLMADNVCLEEDGSGEDISSEWAIEKLVFKVYNKGPRRDRKYVMKASLADSAGVHLSEHVHGKSIYSGNQLFYYHYHNTINKHNNTCTEFVKLPAKKHEQFKLGGVAYVYDKSVANLAEAARTYQRKVIGDHNLAQG